VLWAMLLVFILACLPLGYCPLLQGFII